MLDRILQFISKALPEPAGTFLDRGGWWVIGGVFAVIALLVVWAMARRLLRKLFGSGAPDTEGGLMEQVGGYPPAPPGTPRIRVEGHPARLRLVVLAPVGRETVLNARSVEPLLEGLVRGLGGVLSHDKPKVRVWPPELSQQGFPVRFHRLVKKPQPEGKPSPWVMVAGSTPAGRKTVLIGLVLETDVPVTLGRLSLKPNEWASTLKVVSD